MPDPSTGSGTELSDESLEPTIISSEIGFKGRVWDIRRDVFDYNGQEITRDYVDHPGAVAILAIDDQNCVLLIQQYRHPVRLREWEVPAGLRDIAGEDPLVAAQRELGEEVDLVASDWSELLTFNTSPGGSNETIIVYLAKGLVSTGAPFDRHEEEADIVVKWVPLEDAVAGVLEGRLCNSILAIAVLAAHAGR